MNAHAVLHVASALAFFIVAGFHILRLINGWPLAITTEPYPIWLSVTEIVVAGTLGVLLLLTAR